MSKQSADPVPAETGVLSAPPPGELFGHPKGLFVLFSTELWERFSFYSMRGILTLYMVNVLAAAGGHADQMYGAYLGFVYAATFGGGMLAERRLGQRRAIYIGGGVLMALAQFHVGHSLVAGSFRPGNRCAGSIRCFSPVWACSHAARLLQTEYFHRRRHPV